MHLRTPLAALACAAVVAAHKERVILKTRAPSQETARIELGFSDKKIIQIKDHMFQNSNKSWEIGTAAQALVEFSWPSMSVFSKAAFQPYDAKTKWNSTNNGTEALIIAQRAVDNKPQGILPLMEDGSAADPASIAPVVLLANWTQNGTWDDSYINAAGDQLNFLLHHTPRNEEGAISHRVTETQLWADYMYMVPPFIAYFGALETGDAQRSLLQEAYDQCRVYRNGLRDANGLWRHIAQGSWQDPGYWGTGNAWAAAGMLRVLVTLTNSNRASEFQSQIEDLSSWIDEILVSVTKYQAENGTLYNVIDDAENSFPDSSSTALLGAVAYRMVVYTNQTTHLEFANKALALTKANVGKDGWLKDVVDPYTFTTAGVNSPEGQTFVVLLHSAWRDYVAWLTKSTVISNVMKLLITS